VAAGLVSTWWQYLLLFLAVAASWAGVPVIGTAALGTAAVGASQDKLLDSLGWSVSVAASAYGVGRLATGHHTGHDIAILVIGLAAGALGAVTAVRRHRRRRTQRLGPLVDGASEDPGLSSR